MQHQCVKQQENRVPQPHMDLSQCCILLACGEVLRHRLPTCKTGAMQCIGIPCEAGLYHYADVAEKEVPFVVSESAECQDEHSDTVQHACFQQPLLLRLALTSSIGMSTYAIVYDTATSCCQT